MADALRLAVAQTTVPEDPTDPGTLRESGEQIRALMREASTAGARLVQFPEGALTYPSKRVMSSAGPDRIAAADWSRLDWTVLRAYAELHGSWVGYAAPAQYSHSAPAGIIAPGGRWLARYPADGRPALAVADLDRDSADQDIDIALRRARPWRRLARAGLYDEPVVRGDPRSETRTSF
jgi:hypothetical protein